MWEKYNKKKKKTLLKKGIIKEREFKKTEDNDWLICCVKLFYSDIFICWRMWKEIFKEKHFNVIWQYYKKKRWKW